MNKSFILIPLSVFFSTLVLPAIGWSLTNGSFESGFSGWTTDGSAAIVGSSFGSGPTDGASEALLSTGPIDIGGDALLSAADLEIFCGLPAGSLAALGNGTPVEGSGIKQSFLGNAGETLSFDWNFLTNEDPSGHFHNDFAFVHINPLFELADVATSSLVSSIAAGFSRETGFQTFSFLLPSSGTYLLAAGVVDVTDGTLDSGLLVDNVRLSSAGVPEPGTLLMIALGFMSISVLTRKP